MKLGEAWDGSEKYKYDQNILYTRIKFSKK